MPPINRKHHPMTDRTYQRNYLRTIFSARCPAMDPAKKIELFETLISTGCVSERKAISLQAEITSLRAQMAGQPAAD